MYWLVPLIEWQSTLDLRIRTATTEQQKTITNDNVPIKRVEMKNVELPQSI